MVNLVAGRRIVPELMQDEASGENLAAEAIRLLEDARVRNEMKQGLAEVSSKLQVRPSIRWIGQRVSSVIFEAPGSSKI